MERLLGVLSQVTGAGRGELVRFLGGTFLGAAAAVVVGGVAFRILGSLAQVTGAGRGELVRFLGGGILGDFFVTGGAAGALCRLLAAGDGDGCCDFLGGGGYFLGGGGAGVAGDFLGGTGVAGAFLGGAGYFFGGTVGGALFCLLKVVADDVLLDGPSLAVLLARFILSSLALFQSYLLTGSVNVS
jgi:hypothetical protein